MDDDEFTTEAVPDSAHISWWRVAFMNAIFSLSLPTFVSGLELAKAASPWNFLTGVLAGGALLAVIAGLTGAIGSRTHLSSYMLARIAFGRQGSLLLNLSFALSLLGWFGVNIDLFSDAMAQLLLERTGYHGAKWSLELAAGLFMTGTTVIGLRAINGLALVILPVMAVVTVMMALQITGSDALADILARPHAGGMTFGQVVSAIVGGVAVGAVIMPDTCRFIRHWSGAVWVSVAAYLVAAPIVTVVGGLAALATGEGQMLELMLSLGLGLGAFALVLGGSWTINALNLYSAVLSIGTSLPKVRRAALTIACGIGGTVAAWFNILDHFLTFLFYLAIIFIPVAGIIIVDFFLIRPTAYEAAALGDEPAVRTEALVAWAAGASISVLAELGYFTLTRIAAVDAILVAGFLYAALAWRPRPLTELQ